MGITWNEVKMLPMNKKSRRNFYKVKNVVKIHPTPLYDFLKS